MVEDAGPGQMALGCPACPQPGINITQDTWSNDDPLWLLEPKLALDGNFKCDHLQMKRPEHDVWLRNGSAYLVNHSLYEKHLRVTNNLQDKSRCANHKAVNQANAHHKHVDTTGIGATACARHGFFMPHSVVDFKKGEQQKNMDFSVSEAMKYFTRLKGPGDLITPAITLIYDVMCQYGKHLDVRLSSGQFLERPTARIHQAVGKFHLGVHVDKCYALYSLNFLQGAGQTDGEVLETLWSSLNKVAGSTRAMSLAHRQEILDDCIRLVEENVYHWWQRACDESPKMQDAYEDLRWRITEEDLQDWDAKASQAAENRERC
ncbi:hypothetical protein HGRIS_003978 [Hohenbuehelia grisea]|uniref:CxC2-like cysteine cluster KDZ transposase-associated domain-containing protein n=1 Tax=Hohenbuehelia grisea TaxID=104357 RepID=A0ABR3JIU2_9AGAR